MNIEIFELKYLQFILSSVWNFVFFIIILLIVTNSMRRLLVPVSNFFKNVRVRYKKLGVPDANADKLKGLKPDFLKEEEII